MFATILPWLFEVSSSQNEEPAFYLQPARVNPAQEERAPAMKVWQYLAVAVLWFTPVGAMAKQAIPTAVFGFRFDDTSLQGQMQGPRQDEQQRLRALDAQLKDLLVQSGCCSIVPLGALARETEGRDLQACGGCDAEIARKVGAHLAVSGWVQKVSNLILNINLVARDADSGKLISAGSVDIRGNTDESWSRGLKFLLQDRIHPSSW
jgi:hypothetical protein